jgi:hypothetical protein
LNFLQEDKGHSKKTIFLVKIKFKKEDSHSKTLQLIIKILNINQDNQAVKNYQKMFNNQTRLIVLSV